MNWQGALCEEGRNKVHDQRTLLLQLGSDQQRGGCRGCPCGLNQGFEDRVASHVQKLGSKLAE